MNCNPSALSWSRIGFVGFFLFIYLVTSALFGFVDTYYIAWVSHFTFDGLDIYTRIAAQYPNELTKLTYPPLIYWIIGAWMRLGNSFGLFQYADGAFPRILTVVEYLFFKSFYLPWIFGAAWIGEKILAHFQARNRFLLLLSQPVILFISTTMGQFDIIPTFFCLWAIERLMDLDQKGNVDTAFFFLGLGTALKNFPSLLAGIYFLLLIFSNRRGAALRGAFFFLVPVLLPIFIIYSPALQQSYLLSSHSESTYLFEIIQKSYRRIFLSHQGVFWTFMGFLTLLLIMSHFIRSILARFRLFLLRLIEPDQWPLTVMRIPLLALPIVFLIKIWLPQYLLWLSPWFYLCAQVASSIQPALPPWLHRALTRLPYWFSFVFLLSVPGEFKDENVDSSMLLMYPGGKTMGDFLSSMPSFHCLEFIFLLTPILIIGWMGFQTKRFSGHLSGQHTADRWAWIQLLGFALFIFLLGSWPFINRQ